MTITIIDISYWQQAVDYAELSKYINGVILRAAHGDWKDTWFDRHYDGFAAQGVPIGAYHYINIASPALAQAQLFATAIHGRELRLGKWNDVEETREGLALTRAQVLAYHAEAEKLVGEMGVYTSASKWDRIMGKPDLSTRKLWIANYGVFAPALPKTGGWQQWWIWQYTDKGRLPGYYSSLDMNKFNGDEAKFNAWVGQPTTPDPEPEPPEGTMFIIEMLGNLSIRDKPSVAEGRVMDYALKGEVHHSDLEQGGWYRITRNGITGWISGMTQYTRITKVTQPPEPEPEPEPLTLEQKVDRLWKAHPELHG
jgi:GH25 family lysozyme M1 (1,4-beta-N-acetylmuramidase)